VLVSESDDDDADSDADVLRDVDFLDHLSSAGERPSKPLDCSDLLSSDPLTRRADPYSRRNNHKVGTIGDLRPPPRQRHRTTRQNDDQHRPPSRQTARIRRRLQDSPGGA
jgi:hypothetical protein